MLSPVIVFAYNRKELLEQTLQALQNNELAKDTELFVFVDGPKRETDKQKVEAVVDCVRRFEQKSVFKTTTIYIREKNMGLAKSVIEGVTELINRYGRVIVVEDDLITAPDFLAYMNDALTYYEKSSEVWSVSGYTPRLKALKKYSKDVFCYYRACSWGWGTWLNRWQQVDWDVSDYDTVAGDPQKIKSFNLGGDDMFEMLSFQLQGKIDSWAIRWCYAQWKAKQLCIYPTHSRVVNIGCQNGTHFHDAFDDRYATDLAADGTSYHFEKVSLEKRITREFQRLYSKSLKAKIVRKMQRMYRKLVYNRCLTKELQ